MACSSAGWEEGLEEGSDSAKESIGLKWLNMGVCYWKLKVLKQKTPNGDYYLMREA